MSKKYTIGNSHIDLCEVAYIDDSEEFKIEFLLKSGLKIQKEIEKIDPYTNLSFRVISKKEQSSKSELVVKIDNELRAYSKIEVMKVLDDEKEKWNNLKQQIIEKWKEV